MALERIKGTDLRPFFFGRRPINLHNLTKDQKTAIITILQPNNANSIKATSFKICLLANVQKKG